MMLYIFWRFVLWYVVCVAAVVGASWLLETYANFSLPNGVSAATAVMPPMIAGWDWFRKTQTLPTKSEAWRCGLYFGLFQILVGSLLLGLRVKLGL